MKRIILSLVAAACVATSWADNFNVTLNLKGLPDGTKITLTPMSHDNDDPVATATLQGGKAVLSGTVDGPICAFIQPNGAWSYARIMLGGNEQVTVTADVAESGKGGDGRTMYSFNNMTVTGSPLTDKFKQLTALRDSLDAEYGAFHAEYADVEQAVYGKDQAAAAKARASERYKKYRQADSLFFIKATTSMENQIKENSGTFWGPLLAFSYMTYFTPDMAPMYDAMPEEVKNSFYGQKMKKEVYPGGQAGDKIPAFQLKDNDGKDVTLESLIKGKKCFLIDFWASWCVPCRKEIPNVKANYAKYKDLGLEVISISIDQNEAAWKKALQQEQLPWPNFLDRAKAADAFSVKAIPAMFLVKADGTIIASGDNVRGEKLGQQLANFLK